MRRSDSTGALHAALREAREGIARAEHEREQSAELARRAETEKKAVADDAAAFEDCVARARRHRDEVERLDAVLELRAKDLTDLERRIAHAKFDEAYAGVVSAAERRRAASERLSTALVTAVKAMTTRDAAHDELTAAIAHARNLTPENHEFELPESIDEAEFPAGADHLAKALREGPRRPLAKSAAEVAKQARERERAEVGRMRRVVDRYLDHGEDLDRLQTLPAEQHAPALRHAERRVRQERAAASDVFARRLEQRLERIREIASGVAAA